MQSIIRLQTIIGRIAPRAGAIDAGRQFAILEAAFSRTIVTALIALVLSIIILSAVPPVDRDALTHHLAVPNLYLKHGGIYEIPNVPFSYYPMNLDLIYLIPLALGNDIAPKYIHFGFALLTAGLIFNYITRRLIGRIYPFLSVLLFLSLPVIVKLSITVYVDLGLIFFSTAAFLQLLRWAEKDFRAKHLVLSGAFAGLCLGTKPNGMLVFFFLAAVVPFVCRFGQVTQSTRRQEDLPGGAHLRWQLKQLGWTIAFAGIALMIYSPWMVRNYIWTGNPVYPMAQSLFVSNDSAKNSREAMHRDGTELIVSEKGHENSANGLGHFSSRNIIFGESLAEILTIPVRVFFEGQDDNPQKFDGRLNPYLLVFPLVAVMASKARRRSTRLQLEIHLLGAFSLLYLLFTVFLVDMRIRYLAPIIPPLVILAAIGIRDILGLISCRLSAPVKQISHAVTVAFILCLLSFNMVYLVGQFGSVAPMSYLLGKISRGDYIQHYRPEYAAIAFANQNLPENARILALFNGNRIYYSEREMICDNESFRRAVHSSKSSTDLSHELKKRGVSHLLVRQDLFRHWVNSQFVGHQVAMLKSFFAENLTQMYHGHGYALFALPAD